MVDRYLKLFAEKNLKGLLLLSLISTSILALSIRGGIPEKTYVNIKVPASEIKATIISYNVQDDICWKINNFTKDIDNWNKNDDNTNSILYVKNGILNLETFFSKKGHQSVIMSRSLDVNISELPIFSINISVSKEAIYHIRFLGIDSKGNEKNVWWETSPLDDIPGKSEWVTHIVDLTEFSKHAVGSVINKIASIEIIIDNPLQSEGMKSLSISHIRFMKRNFETVNIRGDTMFTSSKPFQAVVLKLPGIINESWTLRWASVTYILTSNSEFEYVMPLIFKKDDELFQYALGPVFLTHKETFIDIYRLDSSPTSHINFEELTLLPPLMEGFAIIILKKTLDNHGFFKFKLNSIEFMLSNKDKTYHTIDAKQIHALGVITILTVMAIPVMLITLVVKETRLNKKSGRFRNSLLIACLIYGTSIRLLFAPLTGHPYDMEVWVQTARLFYESGIVRLDLVPLPFIYYILLLTYSPYALMRVLGFNDLEFLAHKSKMVESLFIKIPFIISDLVIFLFIMKILNEIDPEKATNKKRFTYALSYYLSPLAILLSGVWGMYDTVAIALFLIGIYYMLSKKKQFLKASFLFILSGLTKGFGFIGLIPTFSSMIRKRTSRVLSIFSLIPITVIIFYMPLIAVTGTKAIPEIFTQFLRGRVGLGSNPPFIASDSYMSYLSILNFNVKPSHLTYLLIALVILLSVHFYIKILKNKVMLNNLAFQYFILIFFTFYLTFFRVYGHYYLWIIPFLIIYSYIRSAPVFWYFSLCISLVAFPILLLGSLFVGSEYYLMPLNLPADAAILSVLPSTIIAYSLIYMLLSMKFQPMFRSIRTNINLIVLLSWFSFSLAYYNYYKVLFLGFYWYTISMTIIFVSLVLHIKKKSGSIKTWHYRLSASILRLKD